MKFDEFNNIEVPEEVDVFIKNGVKKASCNKKFDIKKQKTLEISVFLWYNTQAWQNSDDAEGCSKSW